MAWLQALTTVDWVIIVVLLVALAVGWAQGLVEVLTGFLVFIVSTFVAARYSGAIVGWLNKAWGAQDKLAAAMERRISLPAEANRVPAGAIPWERAADWLRDIPLPASYRESLAHRLAEWSQVAGNKTAASFLLDQLAGSMLNALVFVVIALVLGWVLALVAKMVSDQIKEIPLVGTANRMLGATVTVFETAVMISFVVGLVAPMLAVYLVPALGQAIAGAQLSPYFVGLYSWAQHVLAGSAAGSFFI